jgi:hypothetical protein
MDLLALASNGAHMHDIAGSPLQKLSNQPARGQPFLNAINWKYDLEFSAPILGSPDYAIGRVVAQCELKKFG